MEGQSEYNDEFEEEEEEEECVDNDANNPNCRQQQEEIRMINPNFLAAYLHPGDNYTPTGCQTLRGGKRAYNPCVLDRTGWENFYLSLPLDYDIKNDPVFNCLNSTYHRVGDLGFAWPEPSTSEMLRTGHCGPDPHSSTRPSFLYRTHDKRPEPAYRLHLSDRTALHYMRADPLEGVIPFGRKGDMLKSKSVNHRDFKWRAQCCAKKPTHQTFERQAHRIAKNDLHDVMKNGSISPTTLAENVANAKLMKLKKAYLWPIDTITGESLGGHLVYKREDPCTKYREEIWPCGEKNDQDPCPVWIPEDRCRIMANGLRSAPKMRERHFYNKSYLDMRYPMRNFECWEEVPACCARPDDIPKECCFLTAHAKLPEQKNINTCPPRGPCPTLPRPPY